VEEACGLGVCEESLIQDCGETAISACDSWEEEKGFEIVVFIC
jgi:hypothetical protein